MQPKIYDYFCNWKFNFIRSLDKKAWNYKKFPQNVFDKNMGLGNSPTKKIIKSHNQISDKKVGIFRIYVDLYTFKPTMSLYF